jgi:hypothetical protein
MHKNIVSISFLALLVTVFTLSCNKPTKVELSNEGTLYMPQAVGTRAKIDLQLSPNAQEIVFGAAYGGLHYSKEDNAVSFQVDPSLVAAYNTANGTSYTLLPANAYTISGLNSVIPAGSTSSNPLAISVSSSVLPFGIRYMLPVKLVSTSSGTVDPSLQTTYFRFDTIIRKSVDVTGLATLTVSNENPGGAGAGEGSLKLVDSDLASKYLYFGFNPAGWFQLQFTNPVAVGAYTFTSANDASGRDPKNWILKGSNDGTNWTDIDARNNEMFAARAQTNRYEIAGIPQAYTHYRVFLTANNGSTLFQMAEWRLIKYE